MQTRFAKKAILCLQTAALFLAFTSHKPIFAAPPAPDSLIAIPGNGIVSLVWKKADGAQTYCIYRSESAGDNGTKIIDGYTEHVDNTLFPPEPENFRCDFGDTTVLNGTTYYYRVTAVGGGESPMSEPASAMPVDAATGISKGRFLKIMPMGNSITCGWQGPDIAGGYRIYLYDSLTANNYDFMLVGSYVKQSMNMADPYHEGYNNKKIEHLHYGQAQRAMSSFRPDIVLLEIGTNNFAWGWGSDGNVPGALASYDSLLTTIFKYAPNTTVLAAPIPPVGPLNTRDDSIKVERIALFNQGINELVNTRAGNGQSIVFVSGMYALTLDYLGDGVHPVAPGYTLMGAVWYRAIDSLAGNVSSVAQNPARRLEHGARMIAGHNGLPARTAGDFGALRIYSVNGARRACSQQIINKAPYIHLPAQAGVYIADIVRANGISEKIKVLLSGPVRLSDEIVAQQKN